MADITLSYKGSTILELSATGTKAIKTSGKYCEGDITLSYVKPSGGGLNCQANTNYYSTTAATYTATGLSLSVAKTGTYTVSWDGARNTSSGTSGSELHIAGTKYGSSYTTFIDTYYHHVVISNVALTAGQTIEVYARARSTSYKMDVGNLVIQETDGVSVIDETQEV